MEECFIEIKRGNVDRVLELLDNDLDVNLRDNGNMYLIQYAILYNQEKIVVKLLAKNCKIDMIDVDGYSILYLPIKYRYDDMLRILVDTDMVGIPIYNIIDKHGALPIYYAIKYMNANALRVLLKKGCNINILNKRGDSILHVALKNKNITLEMAEMLLDYEKTNINIQNANGETALHIACYTGNYDIIRLILSKNIDVNKYDYDNHHTALIYIIYTAKSEEIFDLLMSRDDINVDHQSISGHTALHFALYDMNEHMVSELVKRTTDFNLLSVESMTPLHLYLYRCGELEKEVEMEIGELLLRTDLNIQNLNGDTVWHELVKKELWRKYEDVLVKKKNNVFIRNRENVMAWDMVDDVVRRDLVEMLAMSYYNNLDKNMVYTNEWEIRCAKSDYSKCRKLIIDQIMKNNISVPQKKSLYCNVEVKYDANITVNSTYRGFSLDTVSGLIMLHDKYKKQINSTLETDNILINRDIEAGYRKMGLYVRNLEFLNVEINWLYQNMYFPSDLANIIITTKKRFVVMPLGIHVSSYDDIAHSNILLYDRKKNMVERFEPNGSSMPSNYNYNDEMMDNVLEKYFQKHLKRVRYLRPKHYLPKIGFQMYENMDIQKTKQINDPGGFCSAWCIWYVDKRIEHSKYDIEPKKLAEYLIRKIIYDNMSFRNIIRNYSKTITDIRDGLLSCQKMDINDFDNNNYTKSQIMNMEVNILKRIGYCCKNASCVQ